MRANNILFKTLFGVLLSTIYSQGADWTHTKVASASISTRPVICSDPLGTLHIAWSSGDYVGVFIQYATNQSGSWSFQKQVAGSSGNQAYSPSITADQEGYAYIVFRYYGYNYEPRYVTDRNVTGNYWNLVRSWDGGHYHETLIEVDSEFQTHVFAQEDAYNNFSNVYYQQLDTNNIVLPNITQFYSTAIDLNNALHFVGYNDGSGIYYTYYDGSSWSQPDTIDQVEVFVCQPSIVCDLNNVLHVAFSSNNGIYYLNNSGGDWSIPELATDGGIFPNIVADENGRAHIAYTYDTGGLFYTNNVDGNWIASELIALTGSNDAAHVESKIALDPKSNTVNIVYISNGTDVILAQTDDYNLRSVKSTDTTSVLISLAATAPGSDTLSTSASGSLDMLHFSIEDIGGDGLPTKMKKLILQRGPGMSTDVCFNDVFSKVTLTGSDGTNLDGTIYGSKIMFGSLDNVWKEVPDNTDTDFTVSVTLKQPLQNIDKKSVQLKINGLYDIITDPGGSQFDYSSTNVLSDTLFFQVVPDHFEFVNLGSDFYNENLIEGFWMQVRVVDANGNIAAGVTGINLTLSAVEPDGVMPTAQLLQSTEGLTKTLTGGYAQWNNLSFPEPGRIRILATCDILTAASDTITVMPLRRNLVITSDEAVKTALASLKIDADYYSEANYQFPTASKTVDYESILMFPSGNYAWYIDSTKIKYFLAAGRDTARKSILAFGENGLGYLSDTPFSNSYFGTRFKNYFDHEATSFDGVSGNPITAGLSLSASSFMTMELMINANSCNSVLLTQTGTGKIVGVSHDSDTFRTVTITPEFSIITADADRDSLLCRIIRWFHSPSAPQTYPPVLTSLQDINMPEDSPFKMAISDWYPFVEDADTPDENLIWDVRSGVNVSASIQSDTLFLVPNENYSGPDSITVIVSDGNLSDTGKVRINVLNINDPPGNFALLTPNDGAVILDTVLIQFSWEISNDIESRSVNYSIQLYNDNFDTTIYNGNRTEINLPASIFPTDTELSWTVFATDTEDTTIADNAPFTFQVQSVVGINVLKNLIPEDFVLFPNYPNPFNPETTIKYGLPEESFVTISIYDINGRLVRNLIQKSQAAGYHSITWRAVDCVSGVYFYRISAGDFQQVRKCVLMK